jgi:hypothetical protein
MFLKKVYIKKIKFTMVMRKRNFQEVEKYLY